MDARSMFFAGPPSIAGALEPLLARENVALRRFLRLAELREALSFQRPVALLVGGRVEQHAAPAVFHELPHARRPPTLVVLEEQQAAQRGALLEAGASDVFFPPLRARPLAQRLLELAGAPVARPTTRVALPVEVQLSGRSVGGRSLELSAQAATLQLREPLPPRALVRVRLDRPEAAPLGLYAHVLSSRDALDCHQVAVRFVALTRDEERLLNALVSSTSVQETAPRVSPGPKRRGLDEAELFDGLLLPTDGPDAIEWPELPPPPIALAPSEEVQAPAPDPALPLLEAILADAPVTPRHVEKPFDPELTRPERHGAATSAVAAIRVLPRERPHPTPRPETTPDEGEETRPLLAPPAPARRLSPAALVLFGLIASSLACNGVLVARLLRASDVPVPADTARLFAAGAGQTVAVPEAWVHEVGELELCRIGASAARSCVPVVR